ncbi:S9 family peptidase [Pseudonocardia sp. KRD-184]|uniref:S9 family peptidase n=1 Tax=Pseudonocardia oceani TaxID=2792013 RepID=A0ABS6U5D1_9PSEU|nr:S9 family peptidase [Pseudonocardia oceani]MBW0090985.1 S9 family peptidase [Pseudonocardia oceani]MBW0098104.1 S9 family peptidase [Pseudonocardia oceani]MBW0110640.1 S9 family peptidase [Pseudonocardia oceani]MBW0124716.1 S9 family peptidase [Pseudonocardia oceani]MBW0127433.1 S9 family peptidase [Pseudonocardia oceani]
MVAGEGDLIAEPTGPTTGPTSYLDAVTAPDGGSLTWVSDASGRPRAWTAAFDGLALGPARPVPQFDEDVQALSWSPDGLWLAAQLAPGGGERTRVRLIGPDGPVEIAPAARAVTLGSWSKGCGRLGVTILGDDGDGQACLVDVRDGTSTVLASGPAARVCAVSGDGKRAVVRLGRRGARELELVDLRSGLRTPLLPGGGAVVADARFDRSRLYVHTDAGHDRPVLLAVDLRGRSATRVIAARDDADLDVVAMDPEASRLTLVWNVDGRSELELLDLRSGRAEPLTAPAGDVVTSVAFTRDGRALLVGSEGPAVPPRVSHVPLWPGGVAAPLLADAPPPGLVEPDLERFTAEDGLPLTGWMFRPRTTPGAPGARRPLGPVPVLLWLHGGPEWQERPVWQPLFQSLLAAGIAVFAPNVRGSTGYGRAFVSADDGPRRHRSITDVRAAVRFLVDSGHADPARVGVAGRSYGGYLTLVALAWYPELFVVGVDVCGMSDLHTFYRDTEPWIATAATTEYGDPSTQAALLRDLSPIHRVDRITAPLLVVHGEEDTNVPLGEASQIVAALRERGRAPGFLLFPGEGHEVRGVENRERFVDEVVRWVSGPLLDADLDVIDGRRTG